MTSNTDTVQEFLFRVAVEQCKLWMTEQAGDENFKEYIKGFWFGIGFSLLTLELNDEFPNSTAEDLDEYMQVEVPERAMFMINKIQDWARAEKG